MAGFIQNIIWNSVEGFVEAGKRSAGEYAGNALIKVGDVVENTGRSVGTGIERKATSYGSSLSGQTYQAAPKALPSTARKPAVKRSNSLPASSKPMAGVKSIGPTSKTPIGANKYPGANQVNGATKRVTNGVGGAKSAVGGVTGGVVGGAQKSIGGVTGVTNGATKTVGGVTNGASKTLGGVTNGASKTLGGVTNGLYSGAQKPLGALPKPYPNSTPAKSTRSASLPRPYPNVSSAFPSAAKNTVVKPGQPKPFQAPATKQPDAATPYPGTNTLPGQASKTPVKPRYTPAPRLGSQVKPGQKMNHIAV
ncbi:hypothetical protein P153DRAFT_402266 [Dothidotthia symphoricarpi CBS 119687]|uniref:Uncharacterized protein n=1 Tax=Dothidotthia symphoricarpi CBS 119687 TaxID=1392245 RepID=A0A6A6ARH2_9PLEO|nr:uncharacterized protein P153DRAFT_402266 [Dothidotthia symphoricarpi CBS 119687]KAF2134529.1 hypothetical protein P153DRAFT_402266 [Dothidotthia symphoricarpi CBS 119687]